jgi:RNA polymerase sigma factor (sigma-70 family)
MGKSLKPSPWVARNQRSPQRGALDDEDGGRGAAHHISELVPRVRAVKADGHEAAERRALVERALDELPAHQRVPLVLYHFEAMPYDEIAQKLGVSLAKIKTDILRARAALATILLRAHGPAAETLRL